MITGLGFTEMAVIFLLVLVFFGSKELPHFAREGARLLAKARRYSDKVRRELDEMARPLNDASVAMRDDVGERKRELRKRYRAARKELTEEEREEKSEKIWRRIKDSTQYREARAVMAYMATTEEVQMRGVVEQIIADGKRLILPYCRKEACSLGIAEVRDPANDLVPGNYGIMEPRQDLRRNFLCSDLDFVIVPGVAFDRHGGRLGQGKAYYDNFLKDLKGNAAIWGVAFSTQITDQVLPFDYHDVSVDRVVTEDGFIPDVSSEE
ncbi:MAG: 5-formyltetrahydrofolate cyclo-ligase [Chitinivibrionales bacterium]|nr:5-formyltetrahydrofolate cyclo-ligase [Chitinivibrionales bacterium]MBD3358506.1 5-formyltetrahydrofolate cyclo-ligase [Chitinivibrionales bacterium]